MEKVYTDLTILNIVYWEYYLHYAFQDQFNYKISVKEGEESKHGHGTAEAE